MERLLDTYEASSFVKKRLIELTQLKSSTSSILRNVREIINENYEGKKIETELGRNFLTIYTDKKKNITMNEIKNNIETILLNETKVSDLDMIFNIFTNDNKIIIKCKRNMEQ